MADYTYTGMFTEKGQALAASLQAGEKLVYLRVAAGSGTSEDPVFQTDLCYERQELMIVGKRSEGNTAVISVVLDCSDLEEQYSMRQIGIWARTEHQSDEQAVLYKIIQFDSAIEIPARSAISITFQIRDSVFNADNVEVVVTSGAFAPISHVSDAFRHIFVQRNVSSHIVADGGGALLELEEGDKILLVTKVSIGASATLDIGFGEKPLIVLDDRGGAASGGLEGGKSYVVSYVNGTFVVRLQGDLRSVDGVLHFYNASVGKWETVRKAGEFTWHCGSTALPGTLIADGRQVSAAEYPELFAVLGSRFGDANTGQFRLPNLIDRVTTGGTNVGQYVGTNTVSITVNNIPSMSFTIPAHSHDVTIPADVYATPPNNQPSNVAGNWFLLPAWQESASLGFSGSQRSLQAGNYTCAVTVGQFGTPPASAPITDLPFLRLSSQSVVGGTNNGNHALLGVLRIGSAEQKTYSSTNAQSGTASVGGTGTALNIRPAGTVLLPLVYTGKSLI